MNDNLTIQLFEGKKVRIAWNAQEEKYYFSITDIVEALTESTDPKQYIKRMRQRDPELDVSWGTICTPTRMMAADGKVYKTQAADLQGVFRIIQSIPSKKAEPLRQWLAEVGQQRIDQMIDPELSFQMAVEDYRRHGYSDRWIEERLKSIRMRKELTDEWERSGITEKQDFAILTNILTKAWSGMTTGEYKEYKGLTKENLRDNMTNVELALNTLAEVATTEISHQRNPKGFVESRQTAVAGGNIAKTARMQLEAEVGHSVISQEKAADYIHPIEDVSAADVKGKLPFEESKE